MITCIATDMDGTLLNAKQEVSEENRKAILEAIDHGVEVIVATGRSYEEARYPLSEAGIKCPVICVNGAEVRNADGDITYSTGIEGDKALKMAQLLNEIGLYFEVYTNKGTYTEDYERGIDIIVDIFTTANPEVSEKQVRQSAKERFDKGHINLVGDYSKIFNKPEFIVYKFLVFSFDEALLQTGRDVLKGIPSIAISSSGNENLEITSVDAQKGIALERFITEKSLNAKDAMAVGDNFNDLSMMKVVGRPVAMGNAAEAIKDFCRYQTASNNEDGVAKAIREALQTTSV
ncbi:Cof subfamily protein (haloacid dehalogenase superfamily) [Bacillus pakistanensis]|uniref:Cof subfamily protein (Haloacid dehalogenase superfamily) n=1 Tax=Rossellomorea pakistanensis TaxID=992288 RepID=A0ABS2NC58_9BACI|nr:Cof-type HAD-IIB family hydrolase [Bacillus pakistanensis]MBM7585176.1 Cof subfamily protein (haloacid dehalogenase superfamily) [Bacillus pakistanensis]